MARIKYGALVTEINGKIAGTVFQRNRYGFTVKALPNQPPANSIGQQVRQGAMFRAQQAWAALSPANRTAWETYASTFPRATRLNANANLNGFNYFLAYHLLRFTSTSTVLANPSGAQQTVGVVTMSLVRSGAQLELNYNVNPSGGDWRVVLFSSQPVQPTTNNTPSRMRIVGGAGGGGDDTIEVQDGYLAAFGRVPEVGEQVIVQLKYLNENNGQIFQSGIFKLTII